MRVKRFLTVLTAVKNVKTVLLQNRKNLKGVEATTKTIFLERFQFSLCTYIYLNLDNEPILITPILYPKISFVPIQKR